MLKNLAITTSRVITCLSVIFCSAFAAQAQNASPSTFRQSGDTLIFSASPIWGSTLSSFAGYTPVNSAKFNAVMEKNGYAPIGDWMYSVGLGRSYTWNNFHVGVYGYFGIALGAAPSNSDKRSSLSSFGVDEYIGYVVAQNETFRLFPQVGLHLNFRSFTGSDRNSSIDASTLQLGAPQPASTSLTLTGLDMAASIGIGGDVRIPFPRLYKMEGNETVYREDLIIGFQAAYAFDLFPQATSLWSMNGTRVNNLPSVSSQGFMFRLTFTADIHAIK
jgi:hypothetical protein